MWVSKVSFLSINTSKHLLEVTYETILLSMDMALGKSLDLLFKLYVDPMSIKLVFKGCTLSLLTVSQSQRFSKSELILLARTFASVLEAKIRVSSAYKQGVINSREFSKSFMKMRNSRGPGIDP